MNTVAAYLDKILNSYAQCQVNRLALIRQQALNLRRILQFIRCHHLERTAAHLWARLRVMAKPVRRLTDEVPGAGQTVRSRMNSFNIPDQDGVNKCVHHHTVQYCEQVELVTFDLQQRRTRITFETKHGGHCILAASGTRTRRCRVPGPLSGFVSQQILVELGHAEPRGTLYASSSWDSVDPSSPQPCLQIAISTMCYVLSLIWIIRLLSFQLNAFNYLKLLSRLSQ